MTTNDAAPAATTSAEDAQFELEIAKRNPGRRISRYDFPRDVSDARSVYLFELKGKDEIRAAEQADMLMGDSERKSQQRANEAERRESVRLSIVGLIMDDGAGGAGARRIIDQSIPLMEIDDWSSKGLAALRLFHSDLNGLPMEELGKAVRGARKIGAASAPIAPLPAG